MVPALLEQTVGSCCVSFFKCTIRWLEGQRDQPWHDGPTPDSPASSPFSVPSLGVIAKDEYRLSSVIPAYVTLEESSHL